MAALLGNEHKARVDDDLQKPLEDGHDGTIAVAHGIVELPTARQALATPHLVGRVRRILVQPTQRVLQGQILAEIESLELRTVQLDLLQTLIQARLIERSLTRLEGLYDEGVVARRQRWEMESEYQVLLSRADRLQRQLAYYGLPQDAIEKLKVANLSQDGLLSELVRAVPVRAPVSGRIAEFRVVPGQVVHPEEPLFLIQDLSKVWVKGFVYERDANRVRLGQSAHVHFAAYPKLEANGKVVRISPSMHENMRVLPVWVEVSNPNELLKSGMLARLAIMERVGDENSKDVARLQSIEANRK